jgi:two-component system sensor histidine kinase QseC
MGGEVAIVDGLAPGRGVGFSVRLPLAGRTNTYG